MSAMAQMIENAFSTSLVEPNTEITPSHFSARNFCWTCASSGVAGNLEMYFFSTSPETFSDRSRTDRNVDLEISPSAVASTGTPTFLKVSVRYW
jgi:hypothetical protein